jgi:hypothetical protein
MPFRMADMAQPVGRAFGLPVTGSRRLRPVDVEDFFYAETMRPPVSWSQVSDTRDEAVYPQRQITQALAGRMVDRIGKRR